ncbi:MAG TPA: O-antigen ligase family protein [Thermoanaerobaculia bacterium]|nr:O-antigen ligase family protein [Thermoanaerobaculia bacterium]
MTAARGLAGAARRLGLVLVWTVVLIPPFLISPTAEDAFRLPKLAASETLALASLLALSSTWWSPRRISLFELLRRPATSFALLLAAAVAPGAIWGAQSLHWERATTSLAVALGCLVLWSLELDQRSLRRALDLLVVPAVGLSLLAILQAHHLFSPFAFQRGGGHRYGLTSLAGSVGDLGGYLVLPALALQASLARGGSRGARVARAVLALVVLYALFLSQTLAALLATGVASVLLWAIVLPARRRFLLALPFVVAAFGVWFVPGLERRLRVKWEQLRALELHDLLSGRPDAWKVALAMFREHLWTGVGHGGFRSRFSATKLELASRGEPFLTRGESAHFVNAHNEYLEALAEWGLWGATALAGAALVLARRLLRVWRTAAVEERAFAVAGCAALGTLALASFPLHIALSGYSWLLFAAWLFAEREQVAQAGRSAAVPSAATPARRRKRRAAAKHTARPAVGADTAGGSPTSVPAWVLAMVATAILAPSLALHGRSLAGRLEASRILRTTTQVAQLAMKTGPEAARPMLQANLRPLRRAAELDPASAAMPMAIGSHYLLLGNAGAAGEAYERALAIEPRATLYLNLARVRLLEGRREEALGLIDAAVTLDPALRREAETLGWRSDRLRPVTRSER